MNGSDAADFVGQCSVIRARRTRHDALSGFFRINADRKWNVLGLSGGWNRLEQSITLGWGLVPGASTVMRGRDHLNIGGMTWSRDV